MARTDVNAIGHHHTRAVSFHRGDGSTQAALSHGREPEFGDANMLVDDLVKGHSLANTLGQGRVALLRGHGAVVVGETIPKMVLASIYLKQNAQLVLQARQLGDLYYLTPGEVQKTHDLTCSQLPMNRAWNYYVARAGFRGM